MSEQATQEYDENLMALLEAVWGEGFMSPGGIDEVDRYLTGIKLAGHSVLDIGCGLGGIDVHLVKRHGAALVIGIDVDQALIDRCDLLAQKYYVTAQTKFIYVDPGPLPFGNASFEIVTSKDSIIHIPDKKELAADVYRVLEPGGWFVASDWLAGYDDEPSHEMQEYLVAEGLDFRLASAKTYLDALESAGFTDIDIVDRNDWYRQQARQEREQMGGVLYDGLASKIGTEFLEHEIEVWDKMMCHRSGAITSNPPAGKITGSGLSRIPPNGRRNSAQSRFYFSTNARSITYSPRSFFRVSLNPRSSSIAVRLVNILGLPHNMNRSSSGFRAGVPTSSISFPVCSRLEIRP